jgi:hypothetical protein
VVRAMANCLAFDPRGEQVWLGSGWSGTAWVWTICDSRTAVGPPVGRSGDAQTIDMEALHRSIGLRLTADRRLTLV